jgi:hypothetical protein
MNTHFLFAVTDLKPLDPEIEAMFVLIFSALALAGVGMVLWYLIPIIISKYRHKRDEKIKATTTVWFDSKESLLRRGPRQLRIEERTIEFFVCKMIFNQRDEYQLDEDVLEEYDRSADTARPVYQAITRLNKKTKSELKIKDDLFIRGKSRTALNPKFR